MSPDIGNVFEMESARALAPGKSPWWRRARSLKVEIALAFGIVIVLMLALGVAFYLSERRSVFVIDKLLKSDERMADLSLRSALAMEKARSAEGDFLLSAARLGVAQAREQHMSAVQNHLLDMREYLTSVRIISSDPVFQEKVSLIEQQTKRYEDGFLAFVALYGKPGQASIAGETQRAYVAAALAIEPMLEDLHTTASKRATQTLSSVESAARITRWIVFVTVAVAAVIGVIVAVIVSRRITGSVTQLIAFSERVAAGDFSARAQQGREHEFALLANAMNQMALSLENSQAELLATARQAGMAEIATNVLHNVGNILNSVNVSADLVGSTLRSSRAQGLSRAVSLMDEHAADLGDFLTFDPKGKLLPDYMRGIVQALAQEQKSMIEELGHLIKSIDHIKNVVATQQSYAGRSSILEPVQIRELVEDALRINDDSLARHQVIVAREFADVPVSQLDKTCVMQILVNLISNARNAMDSVTDRPHRLTLQVDMSGDRLRVCVKDNGEGISAANLAQIFSHGFTTRKEGHGFGLHSCALAAAEMGGTLSVHSDGPGQGASFTLELPMDTTQAKP